MITYKNATTKMQKKHEVRCRRILSLLAIVMGIGYVVIASSLIGKAMRIIASVDSGILPAIGLVLVSAGALALTASRLGR